jgi:hypothetical protein
VLIYPYFVLINVPDEDDRVGMFITGHPLTPETCYYEAEIMDTY